MKSLPGKPLETVTGKIMKKRYFFIICILLLTVPLAAGAREKKVCRLCDPPDPPVRKPIEKPTEEPFHDVLFFGWSRTWSRSGSDLTHLLGMNISLLFSRSFGMDCAIEQHEEYKPLADQETRIDDRISLSGLWFINGLPSINGFSFFGKLGAAYTSAVRYESETDTMTDLSVPFTLQIGAGLVARYWFMLFGVEVTANSPGVSMENELFQGALNLRIFVGFI